LQEKTEEWEGERYSDNATEFVLMIASWNYIHRVYSYIEIAEQKLCVEKRYRFKLTFFMSKRMFVAS
jgi:hypothetical protein